MTRSARGHRRTLDRDSSCVAKAKADGLGSTRDGIVDQFGHDKCGVTEQIFAATDARTFRRLREFHSKLHRIVSSDRVRSRSLCTPREIDDEHNDENDDDGPYADVHAWFP
jgi:hypothetical protein